MTALLTVLANPVTWLWLVLGFFGCLLLLFAAGWAALCRTVALEDAAQMEREREDEGYL